MTAEVEVVGIVVPARNEEDLLPAALRALDRAAQPVLRRGVVVDLLVVADSCADATVEVARSVGVAVLEVSVGAVGPARAAGFRALLKRHQGTPRARFWLVSTGIAPVRSTRRCARAATRATSSSRSRAANPPTST